MSDANLRIECIYCGTTDHKVTDSSESYRYEKSKWIDLESKALKNKIPAWRCQRMCCNEGCMGNRGGNHTYVYTYQIEAGFVDGLISRHDSLWAETELLTAEIRAMKAENESLKVSLSSVGAALQQVLDHLPKT